MGLKVVHQDNDEKVKFARLLPYPCSYSRSFKEEDSLPLNVGNSPTSRGIISLGSKC